ncbi:MAG: hypothetical protein V4726_12660 [Verrucomicrobiota bacterium]
MKRPPVILTLSLASACTLGFGFWLSGLLPVPAPPAAASAGREPETSRRQTAPPASRQDAPFWAKAEVPEPARFREATGIDPAALGVSQEIPNIDFPAELARLEEAADSKALNSLLLDWLTLDTDAARTWLEEADSLTPYQPALLVHAGRIATGGDCAFAMQWANFVEAPDQRERLMADIYSRGFQTGHFNRSEVASAPIPALDRQNILDGSKRN